jgi:hypothetical protein
VNGWIVTPGPVEAVPAVAETIVASGVGSGVESAVVLGSIVSPGSIVGPGSVLVVGAVDADPAVATGSVASGVGAEVSNAPVHPASTARIVAPRSHRRMPFIMRPTPDALSGFLRPRFHAVVGRVDGE